MKKNRMILLLAAVLWLTSSVSAATIDRIAVRSEAMKKEIPVVVIVPDAAKSGVRMPVLYLLHGYSGDQETWLNVKPSLPQMADRDSVIVVCPDGENSWYWDSPKDPSSRFETFVARELIDYVDAHYPTRGDRSGRAITGLSMGGHGGLWLSFRHKDTFGAGGSTSGSTYCRNTWSVTPPSARYGRSTCWPRAFPPIRSEKGTDRSTDRSGHRIRVSCRRLGSGCRGSRRRRKRFAC